MITRRGLITGLGSILAAPAIVRASSLMPVKVWDTDLLGFNAYAYEVNIGYTVYRLNKSFGEFKEIVAANVLNRRD